MRKAREHVVQRPLVGGREPHAASGDDRHVIRRGQIDQQIVVARFIPIEMPLQLDVDRVGAEQPDQPIEQAAHAMLPDVQQIAAGQGHQAADTPLERLERQRALAFRRAQLHRRDEPAQILIARP